MTTTVPRSAPRMPASPPELIYGTELVPGSFGGRQGVWLAVRLPSYRSLPLSCIIDLEVDIDGTVTGSSDLVLSLYGTAHTVADLRPRRDLNWFVLDVADLFVPLAGPLAPGRHEVSASLQLLTPFATVGRSSHLHTSSKILPLADTPAGEPANEGSVAR
jgi:Domain of unknown function (DUF6379)